MNVIENDHTIFFDVDDTLILWDYRLGEEDKYIFVDGVKLYPHVAHIEVMKIHKAQKHFIVVWSAAGYEWAEKVTKALHLEEYVDIIISKPYRAYDDLSANEFITTKWKPIKDR